MGTDQDEGGQTKKKFPQKFGPTYFKNLLEDESLSNEHKQKKEDDDDERKRSTPNRKKKKKQTSGLEMGASLFFVSFVLFFREKLKLMRPHHQHFEESAECEREQKKSAAI